MRVDLAYTGLLHNINIFNHSPWTTPVIVGSLYSSGNFWMLHGTSGNIVAVKPTTERKLRMLSKYPQQWKTSSVLVLGASLVEIDATFLFLHEFGPCLPLRKQAG